VLRGPPRKPKQSGHALWVGNLPPGTHIIDLKDHFSRDATKDIESVFLISKSNCAFVNYKDEPSCQAAMGRFHDSRFQGVRLVCRLRRGSTASASQTPQAAIAPETPNAPKSAHEEEQDPIAAVTSDLNSQVLPQISQERVPEKYFVVKSLTTDDLERSVQSGVWATQAHNEAALSQAYEVCWYSLVSAHADNSTVC
jgi:RNA recognition motif-containing protein